MCKKCTGKGFKKAFFVNLGKVNIRFFFISILDNKLNKLPARPKRSWTRHCMPSSQANKLAWIELMYRIFFPTQPAFTCSKLITETVEKVVKYVQDVKLTTKTLERRQWHRSCVFVINGHVSHLVLVFLLSTLICNCGLCTLNWCKKSLLKILFSKPHDLTNKTSSVPSKLVCFESSF